MNDKQYTMEFTMDVDYEQFAKDTMSLNWYQQQVEGLVITTGGARILENTLGLVGESGEVAEKVKKWVRDGTYDKDELVKEIGDVLFYVAALAGALEIDLADVAQGNLDKLNSRKERGTLQGSGDNR